MSRILYLDCPSGIAGDMFLSALLDLKLDGQPALNREALLSALHQLPLGDWSMELEEVQRQGLRGLHLDFGIPHQHHHRSYRHIKEMLTQLNWPAKALQLSQTFFRILAKAEAQVHGKPLEEVHFHEVGAVDSLLDLCGAALALEQLGISTIYCSPLPLSGGFVDCAHGRLPVPAPATAVLLQGMELIPSPIQGETITPTGAAILKGCGAIQQRPAMKLLSCANGAGAKDFPGQPNLLRVFLGETADKDDLLRDRICLLRTNIDDNSGEMLGQLWQKAFALGAYDMSYTPLQMKKGRPGWALELMVPEARGEEFARLIFRHTGSIGVRIQTVDRLLLPRRTVQAETEYGVIPVKISGDTVAPEADAVAAAAESSDSNFQRVYAAAYTAAIKLIETEKEPQ